VSVAKEQRLAKSRPRKRVGIHDATQAEWTKADCILLMETIAAVARRGGALRFGYTRDGGAYAVGVYGDGESPYTDYIRPSEDVNVYLRNLMRAWESEELDPQEVTALPPGRSNGHKG